MSLRELETQCEWTAAQMADEDTWTEVLTDRPIWFQNRSHWEANRSASRLRVGSESQEP
jgi:hypothetical protein